ncbi:MAG: ASKHA domain-containing protein [Roseburia sp.]|nr:ASKHA domain-containing protein [Roseburia sp.]
MYKKCRICVNCGRCSGTGGESQKPEVITEHVLDIPSGPIEGRNGERLVTVDIGTTTIAMQLYGTDGRCVDTFVTVNPQVQYGADVLSRITQARDRAKAAHMKALVRGVLQKGTERFKALLQEGERLVMVLAANTTMVYLLMGWEPAELGQAPFCASRLQAFCTVLTADEIPCYVFPGLSAFVGGDIVAGMQAVELPYRKELTLLIDLGTNGEIVLGNEDRIAACATAAGPAFEGGVNRGIWGADMVWLTACLRQRGVLDETGLLEEEYLENGIRIGDVCVTQSAIRALQCAKAAIAAGIGILAERFAISFREIDKVILAGGFGYYLKPASAAEIGLLPEELTDRTIAGGNTALAGALLMGRRLIGRMPKEERLEELMGVKDVEIINLAEEEQFPQHYLQAMKLTKLGKY